MKVSKKKEPLIAGIAGAFIIAVLSYLSLETSTGLWLTFSFGSTTLIVLVFYKSEVAQPYNVFFGHLLAAVVGVIIKELFGISFLTLSISVGISITLMMYLKVVHPPAAANPIVVIINDASYDFILFPIIIGLILLLLLSIIINKIILKRNYPLKSI